MFEFLFALSVVCMFVLIFKMMIRAFVFAITSMVGTRPRVVITVEPTSKPQPLAIVNSSYPVN